VLAYTRVTAEKRMTNFNGDARQRQSASRISGDRTMACLESRSCTVHEPFGL
jgi:hypothetical protein